jgi:DNA-binding MarR family transcriptional regulator
MKLEEEIKQTKFKNEFHKLAVNIIFTCHWLEYYHSKMLKPYDITPQQFNILRILRGQHPKCATVSLLQDRMLDKMSNASRLVEKLRLKGLVERHQDEADRRQCRVTISNNGLNLLSKLDLASDESDLMNKNFSIEEANKLNELLDLLRK